MTLTEQQINDVVRQMQQAGRFTPSQVDRWMAQVSDSASLCWGIAALFLISREENAGRIREDGVRKGDEKYYMWVNPKS